MKVLITGGNGFVGLNIIAALLEAGYEVSALVRPSSNTTHLDRFAVKKIQGELTDAALLRKSMEGMDAVIHTAGMTSSDKNDSKKLHHTNVVCTKYICDAMLEAGVKRLVYTSTTSTIGAENCRHAVADETHPLRGFRSKNPYGISKIKAEKLVLSATEKGLEGIILNPAEVVGAYDYNFQWGRIVMAVFHNCLPFMPPGGGSFCHAREVGRAHVRALTQGRPGQRYILSGPGVVYREYVGKIMELLETNIDIPGESYWKTYLKAWLYERFSKRCPYIFRQKPAAEAYRMRVFAGHYYFSSAKAKKELAYTTPALTEMLEDSISWYRKVGIIAQSP